jgi:dienelactone hydrolase
MKPFHLLAAAGLALFSSFAQAQLPPGITLEMVSTVLPEEGAPKAVAGKYAVVVHVAPGNAALKVLHPADLGAFPSKDTLPVIVWGNGGCAIENPRYEGFLQTIASHGFIVISTRGTAPSAPAPAAAPPAEGAPRPRQANAVDLASAIDWVFAENARAGSPLQGKVDTRHVAVMGQSCGGRLSMELASDWRVSTIGVFNAGLQPNQMSMLTRLRIPALFINGGERDFMMGPARATFDAINNVPVFYGARKDAGHTATAYHAGGGEFANVATNWVRWQFKGDRQAAKMFVGKKCELCTNSTWQTAAKGLK